MTHIFATLLLNFLFYILFFYFAFLLLKVSKSMCHTSQPLLKPDFFWVKPCDISKKPICHSPSQCVTVNLFYNSISPSLSLFSTFSVYIAVGSSLSFIPVNPRVCILPSRHLVSLTPSSDSIYFKNAR